MLSIITLVKRIFINCCADLEINVTFVTVMSICGLKILCLTSFCSETLLQISILVFLNCFCHQYRCLCYMYSVL